MRGEQVLTRSKSPPRKRRSSEIVAKDVHTALGKSGRKNGRPLKLGRTKNTPDMQLHVDRQHLDHVPFQKSPGTDAEGSYSGS